MQAAPQGRLRELDSLRGLAALAVVIHHFVLMWPAWLGSISIIQWKALHITILYPLYAGHEAVMLFFVLSGLVLAIPYIRGRGQPYPIYLGRRILRIYAPYLVALALSVLGASIWHGTLAGHGKWTSSFWSQPVSPSLVLQHIAFLGVYDWRQFDFVIWSLIDEMRISIIFPVLALLVLHLRIRTAILLAGAVSFIAIYVVRYQPELGATASIMMTVHYAAFFVLGILLAMHLEAACARFRSLSAAARTALVLLSFCLYNFSIPLARLYTRIPLAAVMAAEWLVAVAAIGFILTGLNLPIARRFLNSSVPAFLGRISYSLYLTHAPILLAFTFILRNRISAWGQFPLYLAATIGFAYVFCITVEEPFMRQGRRLGKRAPSLAASHLPANRGQSQLT
ncbi:acyltransferase [Granulicella sp. S190]|uniref:acyltransferase family protein n=1 Tax=Granulicella sp. S190 TaxID=1747226 RepID=UPI00131B5BF8|nr:acyltransferase [Granulicella sp. S190]